LKSENVPSIFKVISNKTLGIKSQTSRPQVEEGIMDGVEMDCLIKMEPHGQSPWYLHKIPSYALGR